MGTSSNVLNNPLENSPPSKNSLARHKRVSFDQLSVRTLRALDPLTFPVDYPDGAVVFSEGQMARGFFVVASGHLKLYICSRDGNVAIVKVAKAGELLGLHEALAGTPYEVTAEVKKHARLCFIPRLLFMRLLQTNRELFPGIVRTLLKSHYEEHGLVRTLMLVRPATEKLARFFLRWAASNGRSQDRFQLTLTHEEIGEMIGVSRETVTRLVMKFKKEGILAVTNAIITIRNRVRLECVAGVRAEQR